MKKLNEIKEMEFDDFFNEVILPIVSCLKCPVEKECKPYNNCKDLWKKHLVGEEQ